MGHTVLGAFMISILRSHTDVSPTHVSKSFDPPNRFPGEEKDTCGRLDTDSPVLRNHFRSGHARIPTSWKHMFCHTAVQAACHSIITIYGAPIAPRINDLSGLFTRRCSHCGLELKIGPLHTLIIVAFYLACRGMPGETMFGPLAILVCLISLGADPALQVVMSVKDILESAQPEMCHHEKMTACELMEAVPQFMRDSWTEECKAGWSCILQVLRMPRHSPETEFNDDTTASDTDTDSDIEDICLVETFVMRDTCGLSYHSEWLKWPRGNPQLSLIWATIQVEILTYRRTQLGDPWISDRFSMNALRDWLEGASDTFATPLVDEGLVQPYSTCCVR
ncbi:hypothetical protein QBC35DRAFT_114624 [Podospora australis]|uniref:Uncharacterized protein n=1 Tax=Podospora australis TaxID=1536484 RepID=A0AAN6WNG7_9PEZI|nr:hypothetical protein QBC35DRAFT_114624 [Podospora australis]